MSQEIIERLTRIETKLDRAMIDLADVEDRITPLERFRQSFIAYIAAIATGCTLFISSAGAAISKLFHS